MSCIRFENINKDYKLGKVTLSALKDINLEIEIGQFICIAGPSGSGKSTFLNLLGLIDKPTSGDIYIEEKKISSLSDKESTNYRLTKLGFIFQTFNLMNVLNIYENVHLPLVLRKDINKKLKKEISLKLIEDVGLYNFIKHKPNELSGGQRQRVAIARALAGNPKIVLADEPTANLDSKTGNEILDLMESINQKEHTTFIFSTHDNNIMKRAHEIIYLKDGQIVKD
jgi:putative ABC transport system ATP-binding protein